MNPLNLNISNLLDCYRQKQITPDEVISYCQQQAAQYVSYNIWIYILSLAEITPYLEALAGHSPDTKPLYGIPFVIKDNIDLANIPTTAACEAYQYTPERHAFVVQQLIDAGAIPLGKTNLDQFATGLVGTRSPYGATKNAFNPEMIAGGSSAGSAVAVALGLASFALGTDTAGSGRVPAAFNHIYGLKPSRGLLSSVGMIPACRTLDCMTYFTLQPEDAAYLLQLTAIKDPADPYARAFQAPTSCVSPHIKVGVASDHALTFFDNTDYQQRYQAAKQTLIQMGIALVEIDITPFLQAATLLYQGPWVSERYLVMQTLINQPKALLDVIKTIVNQSDTLLATDAFKAFYQLQTYKQQADIELAKVNVMMLPTAPTTYTIAEVNANPVELNSRLGTYTNFMNLLDYSAIAIPMAKDKNTLPFGITLFADKFCDFNLLNIACDIAQNNPQPLGNTRFMYQPTSMKAELPKNIITLAVCGAHLSGMPLNHQLTERGAWLLETTQTAAQYRFYALAGGPPYRPGLVKVATNGVNIEIELWAITVEQFGSFVVNIPAPLGIGKIRLADDREVVSFICEPFAIKQAKDISEFGGWRQYMAYLATK